MGTEEARFEAAVAKRVAHTPWWGGLSRIVERVAALLPAHRDTRSGRRNAHQIRLVLLASGILTVALWDSPWAPLALLVCLSALVLPVSDSRRRQFVASLRAARRQVRIDRAPAVLVVDAKYVTLLVDGKRLRRLRRKALSLEEVDGGLALQAGAKKADRLLVVSGADIPEDDLWVQTTETARLAAELR